MSGKRQRGQFYTISNPFDHRAFYAWAEIADIPAEAVLEPFAGCDSLITHLRDMGLCERRKSYDIAPSGRGITKRDTLASFPSGFDVCITNPPWLAKNSASLRGLDFPDTRHDDLYKHALDRCLDNCGYVAALVPESFIRSGLFHDRLCAFVSITKPIFEDTAHPVGLALFLPEATPEVVVYSGDRRIGRLSEIEDRRPLPDKGRRVVFNAPDGNLGLIAVDNTAGESIRFCSPREIEGYEVGSTCRYITKLSVDRKPSINRLNDLLSWFRDSTGDVLMTSYRGLRKDGKYRRRLDWNLARGIICNA